MQRLVALFAFVLLAGCAQLSSLNLSLEEQINRWVLEQEYGKALSALDALDPHHPDYARLKEKARSIRTQASGYEKSTVRDTTQHAQKNEWHKALELSELAKSRLPQSTPLKEHHAKLLALQAQRLVALEQELLYANAESLVILLPVYRQLASTQTDATAANRQLQAFEAEAKEVSARLHEASQRALQQKKRTEAKQHKNLALRLEKAANIALKKQDKPQQTSKAKPSKAANKSQIKVPAESLLQQYQHALKEKDWQQAQHLLSQLESKHKPPQAQSWQAIRQGLTQALTAEAQLLIEQGNRYYTQERYEQALVAWHQARELQPDNKHIDTYIARVKHVLDKLRTLQEKERNEQNAPR
jgi:hypothetical protein